MAGQSTHCQSCGRVTASGLCEHCARPVAAKAIAMVPSDRASQCPDLDLALNVNRFFLAGGICPFEVQVRLKTDGITGLVLVVESWILNGPLRY